MTSVVSLIYQNLSILPYTKEVLKTIGADDINGDECEKPALKIDSDLVKKVLTSRDDFKETLPPDLSQQEELFKAVVAQVRLFQRIESGAFGDFEGAKRIFDAAHSRSEEAIRDLIIGSPELRFQNLEKNRSRLALIKPLVDEILADDFEGFKRYLSPLTGGTDLPHEKAISYIYEIVKKPENEEKLKFIGTCLSDLVDSPIDCQDEEQVNHWYEKLEQLNETVRELFTPEEIKEVLVKAKKIQKSEMSESLALVLYIAAMNKDNAIALTRETIDTIAKSKMGEGLLGGIGLTSDEVHSITNGQISADLLKKFLPILKKVVNLIVDNPTMKKHIEKCGLTSDEVKEIANGKMKPDTLKKLTVLLQNDEVIDFLEKAGVNPLLLKTIPLLNGLEAATGGVEDILGNVLQNNGVRDFLGAFGITQEDNQAGKNKTAQGNNDKGWANGYGKWILGGSSVVLAGIGLFVEDNIIKTLLIGLGALGLGGTVASNLEGIQTMFGAPAKS